MVRLTPFAKVELAVAEVALKMEAERPAANVEVAFERIVKADVVNLLSGLMPEKGRFAGLPRTRQ